MVFLGISLLRPVSPALSVARPSRPHLLSDDTFWPMPNYIQAYRRKEGVGLGRSFELWAIKKGGFETRPCV
jgi:hypothetical protein